MAIHTTTVRTEPGVLPTDSHIVVLGALNHCRCLLVLIAVVCSAFHCLDTPPPQVFLDPLLPPLAAAAESHPARSVRVAACEALHAITLWMVGTNARRPLAASTAGGGEGAGVDGAAEQVEPTPFHKVYENLFPVLLR